MLIKLVLKDFWRNPNFFKNKIADSEKDNYMGIDTLTKHIAKQTMELKDTNLCVSFVSTIWRDKFITVVYDNLNNKIMNSFFEPHYQDGDQAELEKMIKNFLKTIDNK